MFHQLLMFWVGSSINVRCAKKVKIVNIIFVSAPKHFGDRAHSVLLEMLTATVAVKRWPWKYKRKGRVIVCLRCLESPDAKRSVSLSRTEGLGVTITARKYTIKNEQFVHIPKHEKREVK